MRLVTVVTRIFTIIIRVFVENKKGVWRPISPDQFRKNSSSVELELLVLILNSEFSPL